MNTKTKNKKNLQKANPSSVYIDHNSGEAYSGYYLRIIWDSFGRGKTFDEWFTSQVESGHIEEYDPNEEKAFCLSARLAKWAKENDYYEYMNEVDSEDAFIESTANDILEAGEAADGILKFLFDETDETDGGWAWSNADELIYDLDNFIQARRVRIAIDKRWNDETAEN